MTGPFSFGRKEACRKVPRVGGISSRFAINYWNSGGTSSSVKMPWYNQPNRMGACSGHVSREFSLVAHVAGGGPCLFSLTYDSR